MCRPGTRHCSDDRDCHNARRRHNRLLKRAIVDWSSSQEDVDGDVVRSLEQGPPAEGKRWIVAQGLEERLLTHERVPDTDRWADVDLIEQLTAINRASRPVHSRALVLDATVLTADWVVDGAGDQSNLSVVELAGGARAFHRPLSHRASSFHRFFGHDLAHQSVHEVAAWNLAAGLGWPYDTIVAPSVLRVVDGRLGSLQLTAAGEVNPPIERTAWHEGAFFDALIGQQDRNVATVLHDRDRAVTSLVDHGLAFARPGDACASSLLLRQRHSVGSARLTTSERASLQRLLDDEQLLGVRGCLEETRVKALRDRARRMLEHDCLPGVGEF